jgi:hypothetical protein
MSQNVKNRPDLRLQHLGARHNTGGGIIGRLLGKNIRKGNLSPNDPDHHAQLGRSLEKDLST